MAFHFNSQTVRIDVDLDDLTEDLAHMIFQFQAFFQAAGPDDAGMNGGAMSDDFAHRQATIRRLAAQLFQHSRGHRHV